MTKSVLAAGEDGLVCSEVFRQLLSKDQSLAVINNTNIFDGPSLRISKLEGNEDTSLLFKKKDISNYIAEEVLSAPQIAFRTNPILDKKQPDPASSSAQHREFNMGNSDPIELMKSITCLEQILGVDAIKQFKPILPEDVAATAADTTALEEWVGFRAATPIEQGVESFAHWYRSY